MAHDRKVAFITGAGSGIGRAAARVFAEFGTTVVVADVNRENGAAVTDSIAAGGGSAIFCQTDVTQPASVADALTSVMERFGRLDVLYNNAGGSTPNDGPITRVSDDEFWRVMKVDLYGTWLCCQRAIPIMLEAGGGSIVNTCSMVALLGYPGIDAYTAAKGGVASLTRALAIEYGPRGIRVNAVAPGVTLTERGISRIDAVPASVRDRHVLGLLQPEMIARAAYFLASDLSGGITGQILPVDSGITVS